MLIRWTKDLSTLLRRKKRPKKGIDQVSSCRDIISLLLARQKEWERSLPKPWLPGPGWLVSLQLLPSKNLDPRIMAELECRLRGKDLHANLPIRGQAWKSMSRWTERTVYKSALCTPWSF